MTTATRDTQHLSTALRQIEVMIFSNTTVEGHLMSRPMLLQQVDPDCTMWFFINRNSGFALDIRQHPQVAIAHEDETEGSYLAVSGKAWLVDEPGLISQWWRPEALAWFPLGVTDPDLGLMRVDAYSAHRWEQGTLHKISLQG